MSLWSIRFYAFTMQSQSLKQRKLVKIVYYTIVLVCLLTLLILFRINSGEYFKQKVYLGILSFIITASFPLSILYRAIFFWRPKFFSDYLLYDNLFIQKYHNKEKQFHFSQIEKVQISWLSPRFFGGFVLYMKSGIKVRISSLLEGSDQILERIFSFRPELISETALKAYKDKIRFVPYSWRRMKFRLQKMLWLVNYILFPIALAYLFHSKFLEITSCSKSECPDAFFFSFILFFMVNLILGMLINFFEDNLLNQLLQKNNFEWSDKREWISWIGFSLLRISILSLVLI